MTGVRKCENTEPAESGNHSAELDRPLAHSPYREKGRTQFSGGALRKPGFRSRRCSGGRINAEANIR